MIHVWHCISYFRCGHDIHGSPACRSAGNRRWCGLKRKNDARPLDCHANDGSSRRVGRRSSHPGTRFDATEERGIGVSRSVQFFLHPRRIGGGEWCWRARFRPSSSRLERSRRWTDRAVIGDSVIGGGVQAGEPDPARTRARRRRTMTIAGNDDAETLPRSCRNLGQSEGCLTRVV